MIPVGLLAMTGGTGTSNAEPEREGASDDERSDAGGNDEAIEILLEGQLSKTEMTLRTGLTPEEIVVTVIAHFDGRLYQDELSAHLDWTTSSTSRLLTRMEERGTIERIQIGRRKRVYLPETVPDSASVRD